MEYSGELRELRHQTEDVAHYIVEDTFNNRIWRFEIGEESRLQELLADEHEGPSTATVHLVEEVNDVTTKFVKGRQLPKEYRQKNS